MVQQNQAAAYVVAGKTLCLDNKKRPWRRSHSPGLSGESARINVRKDSLGRTE